MRYDAAIATRRRLLLVDVDHAGWVVTLQLAGGADVLRQDARGSPRLVSGLVDGEGNPGDWGHELGIGPFRLCRAEAEDHTSPCHA